MKTIIKLKKGCGKPCINVYSNPNVFICGEKIKGRIAYCNDCLNKEKKKNDILSHPE